MAGMAEAVRRQLERLHHLLEVLRPGEEPATKLGHCAWCWGRWPAVIGRRRSRPADATPRRDHRRVEDAYATRRPESVPAGAKDAGSP